MRVCLIYPNTYPLGMTNLGFQTVYHLFNGLASCVCERAFLPEKEDLPEYSRTSTPLLSHESQTPVKEFDIIAFSLPFEEDYVNIPRLLGLARVPILSKEREAGPIVIAGGVAVSLNPEPIADFIDIFLIGEGEGMAGTVIETYQKTRGLSKAELIRAFDTIEWVYAPSLYDFEYDGVRIKNRIIEKGAKEKVKSAKGLDLKGLDLPQSFILTPDTEFRDTFLMEVERGCGRGCRFCAAGFLYLPPRWRDIEDVKGAVKKGVESSGRIGLIGTAVSEYPQIKETVSYGVALNGGVTLSSLRMDRLDPEFLRLLKDGGYKTITLAPEAGSQRMREVVNKGLTDDDIMEAITLVAEAGFLKVKLYFIVGLPSETDEDAKAIVDMAKRIKAVLKRGEVSLSVNPFIPKPCTPFQWKGLEAEEVIERRLGIIDKGLSREKGIKLSAMGAKEALIQAYISRADRRAGRLIIEAAEKNWNPILKKEREFIQASACLEKERDDILPWDIIDHGVRKAYLWKEYQKGLKRELTPPCDVGKCFRCGVC